MTPSRKNPDPRPRGASPPGAREIYEALQHLLRSYQARDRDRPCYGDVSITECHALEALTAGPATVTELAAAVRLDKSGASRAARSLERKGYVARRGSPRDRRSVQLEATPEGRRLVDRIREAIFRRHARALRAFSPDLRRALPKALHALGDAAARPAEPRKRRGGASARRGSSM